MPNIQAWLLLHTPSRLRGRVVGIFVMMLYLGQFISPFVALPIRKPIGLSGLFLVGGITLFALLAVPTVLLIINFITKNKETQENDF
jgi:MFS family permease